MIRDGISNSDYRKNVYVQVASATLFFGLLSIGGVYFSSQSVGVSLFLILFGAGLFLFITINIFILRPSWVIVEDQGIRFIYRLRRQRELEWGDIISFAMRSGNHSGYFGIDRWGQICDKKWRYYRLNYEVASTIYNAYVTRFGKAPPLDPKTMM
jgi:hypothetical protein